MKIGDKVVLVSEFKSEEEIWGHEEHIIAQVAPLKVCAINLNNGNRIVDPVKVKKVFDISDEEFKRITRWYKVVK
jgi:hypothetical protein